MLNFYFFFAWSIGTKTISPRGSIKYSESESESCYNSQKGDYSIILQGVVDHRMRSWDINVGRPGKIHDACVLSPLVTVWTWQCRHSFTTLDWNIWRGRRASLSVGWFSLPSASLAHETLPRGRRNNTTAAQLQPQIKSSLYDSWASLWAPQRTLTLPHKRIWCPHNFCIVSACVLHNYCEVHNEDYLESH